MFLKQRPGSDLFHKILTQTMLPSVLLLLAFLAFSWIQLGATARHNTQIRLQNQEARLEQGMVDMERTLMDVGSSGWNILVSREFATLAYVYQELDWYRRFSLQEQLYQMLFTLRNKYDCVESVYLNLPLINRVISGARTKDTLPAWFADLDSPQQESLQRHEERLVYVIHGMDEMDGSYVTTLAIVINEAELYKQMAHVLINDNDQLFLRWDGDLTRPVEEESWVKAMSDDNTFLTAEGENFAVQAIVASKNVTDTFYVQAVRTMIIFVCLLMLLEICSLMLWYRQIYTPLSRLLREAFRYAEEGNLKYRISIEADSPFFTVYDSYNHMMEKMEAYVENNLKQQILVSNANLKQLQSQINPHFMYNSYYVLYRLIKKGDLENSQILAEHLGRFFQYITRNADYEKHLDQEIEHARNYAIIQKFRFREALDIRIEAAPEQIARLYVPRIILQPILENAFKYAYETADGTPMILWVHYEVRSDHSFDILVENSGNITNDKLAEIRDRLAAQDNQVEVTALVNIHRRFKIYFGQNSGLLVERSAMGGLLVRMCINDEREDD